MQAEIYLAGGCFWGVEAYMKLLPGVLDTQVGYANGNTAHPTYEQVCHQGTGHAETVRVVYDRGRTDVAQLLEAFFRVVDPTSHHRQGNDRGSQYRSGIYYVDECDKVAAEQVLAQLQTRYEVPIVTEILPLAHFYPAEEAHQDYLDKHPGGYCHIDLRAAPSRPQIRATDYPKPKDEQLRGQLTDLQYRVTQLAETERPYTNAFADHFEKGLYVDIVTGEPLFTSRDKFDSGCGWPSFAKPLAPEVLMEHRDKGHGMTRTEVRSRAGDSHMGHVFPDGPQEKGGLRYCINSAALRFVPYEDLAREGYGDLKALFD